MTQSCYPPLLWLVCWIARWLSGAEQVHLCMSETHTDICGHMQGHTRAVCPAAIMSTRVSLNASLRVVWVSRSAEDKNEPNSSPCPWKLPSPPPLSSPPSLFSLMQLLPFYLNIFNFSFCLCPPPIFLFFIPPSLGPFTFLLQCLSSFTPPLHHLCCLSTSLFFSISLPSPLISEMRLRAYLQQTSCSALRAKCHTEGVRESHRERENLYLVPSIFSFMLPASHPSIYPSIYPPIFLYQSLYPAKGQHLSKEEQPLCYAALITHTHTHTHTRPPLLPADMVQAVHWDSPSWSSSSECAA